MPEITPQMAERRQRLHDDREVPEGCELVAAWAGPHWQTEIGRRCRYARRGRYPCGKQSSASLLRGEKCSQWWAYCPDHMYAVWVEDGTVMNWILRELPATAAR